MATPHLSRITAWPVIYACSLSCDALAQCGPSSGRAMRGCVTLKFQWLHTWLALFLGKNWVMAQMPGRPTWTFCIFKAPSRLQRVVSVAGKRIF